MKTNPYNDRRWQKARRMFLRAHPLCAMCDKVGIITTATVVDHITPHDGDYDLFWDMDNWQPLCASCHSGIKRVADRHGASQTCDINGNPIDPGHRWNR